MKSVLFATALIAGASGTCSAADMPMYTKAPAPAAYDWTGWSIGVSGGFGIGASTQSDPGIPCTFFGTCPAPAGGGGPPLDGSYRLNRGLFGAGVSYNFWQTGPWVFGITGDYAWADVRGSSGNCGAATPIPHMCGGNLQSLGTARGRLGYAFGPNWLVYGTGGYAGGDLHAWDALAGGSGTKFLSGWSAGAGVEVLVARNLLLRFEYLHVDLGHAGLFDAVPGLTETVGFAGDIFRVGLDLKFNASTYTNPIYTK